MTSKELKELYATGDYIPYYLFSKNVWRIPAWYLEKHSGDYENGYFPEEYNYKLIHKRHSHIAKAVANNPDIRVKIDSTTNYSGNFWFERYDEKYDYKLAKPDGSLDNKRIHVTPETKDAIEALVKERGYEIKGEYDSTRGGIRLSPKGTWICFSKWPDEIKAVYAQEGSPLWDKCSPIHYDLETNSLVEDEEWQEQIKYEEHCEDKDYEENTKDVSDIDVVDIEGEEPKEDTCKYEHCESDFEELLWKEKKYNFCPYCSKRLEEIG